MKPILRLLLFICSGILIAVLPAVSQDPVSLNCLEVQQDGSTILWWLPPTNTTGFKQYEVYYSQNGNTFTLEATITTALTNNYIHTTSNANLGSRYYYVNIVFDDDSAISDTLQTIFLQLDNNMPDYNQADLYWNPVRTPLPNGSSVWYKIYQEYPLGIWTVKDSVTGYFFSEPVIVCNDSISYKIVIENDLGCSSVSNIQGAPFFDVGYPKVPVFDSVSTNTDGFDILGWSVSESEDVTGYIVYHLVNDNWVEIDRIEGRNNTFYIDSLSNGCEEIAQYALAAIDSCGNKSPGTFLNPVQNMILDKIVYNPCELTNSLKWTAYINAQPELEGYRILCSENGGAFSEVGQTDPLTLQFTHANLIPGTSYAYIIQAYFGAKTSSSCIKSMNATPYQRPEYIYFANADILASGQAELTIEVDTSVDNSMWQIWRSGPDGGSPSMIKSFDQNEVTNYPLRYTDEEANGFEGFYQYYASVLDSCETESLLSNEIKTIHLTASQLNENTNELQWNAFEGWDTGVEKYYIFRMINNEYPAGPLDSVSASVLDYTDDLTDLTGHNGRFIYWVQAVQSEGNIFGFTERSNSNQTLVASESELYMPNAFKPGGNSEVFKPVFTFFGGTGYSFQIYSRWGNLIFETNNPDEGWDGKYQGKYVSLGVYSYKLAYNLLDGDAVIQRGTVTVIY